MIFRSTHTDLDRFRDRAFETARRAAREYAAPALLYAESGEMRSSGYSFSNRGGNGGRWTSRWQGVRTEEIGASDRRFAWRDGLGEDAWTEVAAVRGHSFGAEVPRPFVGEAEIGEWTDDDLLARRLVDAASIVSPFNLVEAEVRRQTRAVLICRSDGSPVVRTESGVRWRLRFVPKGNGPFCEWTECAVPDVPEAWAIDAIESVHDRGDASRSPTQFDGVLLEPSAAAVWLHEVIGHTAEADFTRVPEAQLAGAAEVLVPDPVPMAVWSMPLHAGATDDEGNPGRLFSLGSPGSTGVRLADELHARREGLPLTGNGRRQDFRFPILPRIGALRAERTIGPEIRDLLDSGTMLRVLSILSGQVDPVSNRYRLELGRAELWSGGRMVAPLQRLALTGDVSRSLSGVKAVGREFAPQDPAEWPRRLCLKRGQVVETANFCPSVVVSGLEVAH